MQLCWTAPAHRPRGTHDIPIAGTPPAAIYLLTLELTPRCRLLAWTVEMEHIDYDNNLRIGELACRAGLSTDTVRYYERLGLLRTPHRMANGYRQYGAADLRRLQFIRRAKLLGLSLDEIRSLLHIAEEGACQPLRQQVVELLRRKIDDCAVQLAELTALKASLEERYQQAIAKQHEPACGCASFPATCACLPVPIEELEGATHDASALLMPEPVDRRKRR